YRIDFTHESYDTNAKQLLQLLGVTAPAAPQAQTIPTQWEQAGSFLAHRRGCYCVDWSPDGSLLATGSYDRTVIEWDAARYNQVKALTGHTQGVNAVAWSPSGQMLGSASLGPGIRLWDASSGRQEAVLEGHTDGVADIAWSPDGRTLASAS